MSTKAGFALLVLGSCGAPAPHRAQPSARPSRAVDVDGDPYWPTTDASAKVTYCGLPDPDRPTVIAACDATRARGDAWLLGGVTVENGRLIFASRSPLYCLGPTASVRACFFGAAGCDDADLQHAGCLQTPEATCFRETTRGEKHLACWLAPGDCVAVQGRAAVGREPRDVSDCFVARRGLDRS